MSLPVNARPPLAVSVAVTVSPPARPDSLATLETLAPTEAPDGVVVADKAGAVPTCDGTVEVVTLGGVVDNTLVTLVGATQLG